MSFQSSRRHVPRRLGLLAPYAELPGEYQDALAELDTPVVAWQVVTESEDTHDIEGLKALADLERLQEGASRLARWDPDAVAWACTSGSFIGGRDYSLEQVHRLEEWLGVPATSTSLAFVDALAHLDVRGVSVIASYPEPASDAFVRFLGEWDIDVVDTVSWGASGARIAEQLSATDVEEMGQRLTDIGDVILLPDTAVWGIQIAKALEDRLQAPVLAANQVTLWKSLRLIGIDDVPLFPHRPVSMESLTWLK